MLVICDAVSKSTELIAELNKQVGDRMHCHERAFFLLRKTLRKPFQLNHAQEMTRDFGALLRLQGRMQVSSGRVKVTPGRDKDRDRIEVSASVDCSPTVVSQCSRSSHTLT